MPENITTAKFSVDISDLKKNIQEARTGSFYKKKSLKRWKKKDFVTMKKFFQQKRESFLCSGRISMLTVT